MKTVRNFTILSFLFGTVSVLQAQSLTKENGIQTAIISEEVPERAQEIISNLLQAEANHVNTATETSKKPEETFPETNKEALKLYSDRNEPATAPAVSATYQGPPDN